MFEYFLNPKDYGAAGDGVHDDTAALTKCINEAQAKGYTCFIPTGTYLVNDTLLIGDRQRREAFTIQGMRNTVIKTTSDIDLAVINTEGKVIIKEVGFRNEGHAGCCLYLDNGFGHGIYECSFSNIKGNVSPMFIFNGSYTDVVNCSFGNSEPESYAIQCTTIPGKININSDIFDNRIFGSGKGLIVDSSENNRPEGLKVSRNMFLNTGKEQITVCSILHIDISNNMLDQASETTILLDPRMQGLCGVYIANNYISPAQNRENGIGVLIKDRDMLTLTITISNNMIAYSGYGVVSGKDTVHLNINGNAFNDITNDGVVIDNSRGSIVTGNTFWRCKRDVVNTYTDPRTNEAPVIANNQVGDL